MRTFAWLKQLINSFTKLKIKPDFPFLTNEIAEPRPDINIKVAAFTVTQKLYYTSTRELSLLDNAGYYHTNGWGE